MSSRKVTRIRPAIPRNRRFPELDLICRSEEQIRQIRGVRRALKEVVEQCGEHLNVALAIIILRNKGIAVRYDDPEHPLEKAGKAVRGFEKDLADWQKASDSNSSGNDTALPGTLQFSPSVPCKSLVTPISIDGQELDGILVVANRPDGPDFEKHDHDLLPAIAQNISKIIDARFDRLTGLINGSEFEYLLEKSLSGDKGKTAGHCVLHLDLDDLQSLDESLGRDASDEAIRQVAARLASELKGIGPVARIGQDEFGILVENCPGDRGWVIGQEIRRAISGMSIIWTPPIKLTVSIGVAQLAGAETIESALAAAKIACIVAKDRGRDRVALYQHKDALLLTGKKWVQGVEGVQQALRDDRFLLYCQPIEPLAARVETRHFEILLRGIDEEDPLPPSEFMPHAEHSRLMPAIDRWVVTHSLEMIAAYRRDLIKAGSHFAINLSGQSLCDDNFLDFVTSELTRAGVPGNMVCFEVTETTAILNVTRAKQFMSALRRRGCKFSLDDFGSGLSSFSTLKTLPVDYLKIDGQFVREVAEDPVSNAMVAAINQMSHAMGLKTIAEYVENTAIKTQLASIGVDYAQGFGIAKPRPLAEQLELLAKVKPIGGASGGVRP